MGSEWPDKHDKIGFGSLARGGGEIFPCGDLSQLNSVGSEVVGVTGLFTLCENYVQFQHWTDQGSGNLICGEPELGQLICKSW